MAINLNLSPNWLGAPPTQMPIRLWPGGDIMIQTVIPKGAISVTATLTTESGTANAHMAIFAAPSVSGGPEGLIVGNQVDLLGFNATTSVPQTISVSVPSNLSASPTAPAPYVVKLWVDGITGTATGKVRSGGGTADTLPAGVQLISLAVA